MNNKELMESLLEILQDCEGKKKMLNLIEQFVRKKRKRNLPNPNYEYKIVFKHGEIDRIKHVKGLKNDSQLAQRLGLTRQYISMLKHGASVTSTVIERIAVELGNVESGWWCHYEIVPRGIKDLNHPRWNKEKELGMMPYDSFSISAENRSADYKVEKVKR